LTKVTNVKQYKGQPEKDWSNKQWLDHAWIQSHNPWIDERDREYWKAKIKELTTKIYG